MSGVLPIWIAEYIGLEFKEHGRDETGVDCWGLIRLIFDYEFNIRLPSLQGYRNTLDAKTIEQIIKEEAEDWDDVEIGKEEFGDVIVLLYKGHPMHVGMVIEKGRMIHIEKGINSCLERYDGVIWENRVVSIHRHERRI